MLEKAGVEGGRLEGYQVELKRHLEVGIEVLCGRVDAGPGIRAVAGVLDLDFIPFRWERFDFIISKERFFAETVQFFLGLLHESSFRRLADAFQGYDLNLTGKMVFPRKEE
jgi:molybdate-binding protein